MKQLISQHKLNRLQLLAKRWNKQSKSQKLSQKIQRLATELQGVFTFSTLRKTLGAAAILLGTTFSQQAIAQDDISFAISQTNPFGLASVGEVSIPVFVDLDADGDMDILVGQSEEYQGSTFLFFENIGTTTEPNFAAPQQNPFGLSLNTYNYIQSQTFADIDNDGDLDLLASIIENYSSTLKYFENIGTVAEPNFANSENEPFGINAVGFVLFPTFVDLDADGDTDLLVGGFYNSSVDYNSDLTYYENVGTAEEANFGPAQDNPFGISATYYISMPSFADIDRDGDLDLFIVEYEGGMQYFENEGTAEAPNFSAAVANPFGFVVANEYAIAPTFSDLDADGDMDLLLGQSDYANFYYYENTTPVINVGIESETVFEAACTVFPNPTADFVQIKTDEQITKIEISDVSGKTIGNYTDISRPISLQNFPKGLYSLKIVNVDGAFVTKMVQKQ